MALSICLFSTTRLISIPGWSFFSEKTGHSIHYTGIMGRKLLQVFFSFFLVPFHFALSSVSYSLHLTSHFNTYLRKSTVSKAWTDHGFIANIISILNCRNACLAHITTRRWNMNPETQEIDITCKLLGCAVIAKCKDKVGHERNQMNKFMKNLEKTNSYWLS